MLGNNQPRGQWTQYPPQQVYYPTQPQVPKQQPQKRRKRGLGKAERIVLISVIIIIVVGAVIAYAFFSGTDDKEEKELIVRVKNNLNYEAYIMLEIDTIIIGLYYIEAGVEATYTDLVYDEGERHEIGITFEDDRGWLHDQFIHTDKSVRFTIHQNNDITVEEY